MLLEEIMLQKYKELNEIDLDILRYVINHQDEVSKMGSVELAKITNTSKSTITRMAKKMGFKGYSELKYFLREQNKQSISIYDSVVTKLQTDILATLDLAKDSTLEQLVEQMYHSEIIYCYATGNYQRKFTEVFSQQLLSTGKKVVFITEESYLELIVSIINPEDLVILFSLSGETEALKPFILNVKAKGIPLATITQNKENYFSKHADFPYFYYSTPFDTTVNKSKIQTSLTGLMIFTELLFRTYLEYAQEKNVQKE